MKIDSPQFGSLEVASNKVVEFPLGLPGFEACKRYTFIEVEQSSEAFAVLQGVDDPAIAFAVTTPDLLGLHYEFELSEEEQNLLGATRAEDVAVLVILRKGEPEQMRRAGDAHVKANLMAPLVINGATMRGLQKIIAKLGCEVTLKPA
ncbi:MULTISPECIES: flagellar assembly protein FliW [Uliginosibacterium]|uniref:Flagellar assembly factor FliW n=1 Tax=Uliginosibacterium aquaticum TaxID=2731212 RepID=A0ABX2IHZ3_9RHOO|nr:MULTISPECIES: flagellar assembly protein FliW [Uliginosibacterium]NSL56384.1 flagellar assembly protein FliW [Uliginosibacterium aquaticum]PLK47139.1 flagellar biosynthesis protein FliW [Uliginosibacterium sp. TH139]